MSYVQKILLFVTSVAMVVGGLLVLAYSLWEDFMPRCSHGAD